MSEWLFEVGIYGACIVVLFGVATWVWCVVDDRDEHGHVSNWQSRHSRFDEVDIDETSVDPLLQIEEPIDARVIRELRGTRALPPRRK